MVKALSVGFRERVLAVIDGGVSCCQAAARFGVSVSNAIRWHALVRRTGSSTPKRQGGRPALGSDRGARAGDRGRSGQEARYDAGRTA
jgi:transposase